VPQATTDIPGLALEALPIQVRKPPRQCWKGDHFDPRMFPDALRARGVKLEDFTLVSAKKKHTQGKSEVFSIKPA